MKANILKDGNISDNSAGLGVVNHEKVRARAAELAVINGRSAHEVSKADWERAKRDLTNEPDPDPKAAVFESAPESECWDPVLGSTGHKLPIARQGIQAR